MIINLEHCVFYFRAETHTESTSHSHTLEIGTNVSECRTPRVGQMRFRRRFFLLHTNVPGHKMEMCVFIIPRLIHSHV